MFFLSNLGVKASMLASFFALAPAAANASTTMLAANDFVGISFWTISMAMVAATVFFLMEAGRMGGKWRTSLTVGALVTLVAAVHYFYMRDVWASTGATPTVYRYVDWLITVPLQMVEFYFILAAVTVVSAGVFWRLMIGSLVMLVAGYLGEAGLAPAWPAFIIGMAGWGYILYEIFAGEAGRVSAASAPAGVQSAFGTMRLIVTVGWAIYPLGYFFGYLNGSADAVTLNVIYNVADVINKIAFVGIIWAAANAATADSK
jgi:bacteriorhodopsin